jgi:hypothetical protein
MVSVVLLASRPPSFLPTPGLTPCVFFALFTPFPSLKVCLTCRSSCLWASTYLAHSIGPLFLCHVLPRHFPFLRFSPPNHTHTHTPPRTTDSALAHINAAPFGHRPCPIALWDARKTPHDKLSRLHALAVAVAAAAAEVRNSQTRTQTAR